LRFYEKLEYFLKSDEEIVTLESQFRAPLNQQANLSKTFQKTLRLQGVGRDRHLLCLRAGLFWIYHLMVAVIGGEDASIPSVD